ncbi:bacterial alpha-L-rhamnosidase domain-containing protein [Lineolata rhizophorae]|uniref:Bacterial alpha-L-rhamnosidase domain-containing protein n=1 Tax=Lineolata rhizophorae TaxID=578093 RepID=A0A6A6NMK4_9PEZI|nr:bacterial alpha-L-rhamnosidase domain-containing protein [Lineolata rhizophorae]
MSNARYYLFFVLCLQWLSQVCDIFYQRVQWIKDLVQVSANPYQHYIIAPDSRTLYPTAISKINGTIENASRLIRKEGNPAVFNNVSAVTLDFGKNIAGLVSLAIANTTDETQSIGITFSESPQWISGLGSDATAEKGIDETFWIETPSPGLYLVPREHERGAFRYLSMIHKSVGEVKVSQVTTHFTAMPHYDEDQLRNYTGYFHCDDELLNHIWYAGAYTVQLCTIEPKHGNSMVHLNETVPSGTPRTWYNNGTIANGTSALVDGAKRDRLIFSADTFIALPSIVSSTYDLFTVRNSLDSLFARQDRSTGQLPYVGAPYPWVYSTTYHLYTLVCLADYYLFSGDAEYFASLWPQFKLALDFSLRAIDSTGLISVDSPHDWLRFGMGGHNIEANAMLYYVLCRSIAVARLRNDTAAPIIAWKQKGDRIKSAANAYLWDPPTGLYRDNMSTTLAPQDGNAWAVLSNLTQSDEQRAVISSTLARRWVATGAPSPEAHYAMSPFASGLELQAHLRAENATGALELMRRMWGFMLRNENMTGSTFVEGYSLDGSLRYAPYQNDAKLSHAHGWSSSPTSSLMFGVAGIRILAPGGRRWSIEPMLGDLKLVDAAFRTVLGRFGVRVTKRRTYTKALIHTPAGTVGKLRLEPLECDNVAEAWGRQGVRIKLRSRAGEQIEMDEIEGGRWEVVIICVG